MVNPGIQFCITVYLMTDSALGFGIRKRATTLHGNFFPFAYTVLVLFAWLGFLNLT